MTDLEKIEHMARLNPFAERIKTHYTAAQLRKMGLQSFGGKWTHSVQTGDLRRTFEIVPRAK